MAAVFCAFGALAVGCMEQDTSAARREARAAKAADDVVIGAAASWDEQKENALWEGVELALIHSGKTLKASGRQLSLVKLDDNADVSRGQAVAQQLCDNPDALAVLGHYHSYVTAMTAGIYAHHGLVLVSPWSTATDAIPNLLGRCFLPAQSDKSTAAYLARICKKEKFALVAIYHCDDDYGHSLANAFEQQARQHDVVVQDRIAFDAVLRRNVVERDLTYWKRLYDLDAILLIGAAFDAPDAPLEVQARMGIFDVLEIMKKNGLALPIITSEDMAPEAIASSYPEAVIYETDLFNPEQDNPLVREFVDQFQSAYGMSPADGAALGYDVATLLFSALSEMSAPTPDLIAAYFANLKNWSGVTGDYVVMPDGSAYCKQVWEKKMSQGTVERTALAWDAE